MKGVFDVKGSCDVKGEAKHKDVKRGQRCVIAQT